MINLGIPHWQRRVSGETVFLVAPEGLEAGVISIVERVRPVVTLAELCRGRGEVIDGPKPITSDEGEDGAVVSLDDGRLRHDVGVLVGDEFLATVIGVTGQPIHFERTRREVEGLLVRFPLLLGVRRRLFHYPPPPKWRPVARGLEAEYYAPEFPRDPSRITVFPALPAATATAAEAIATLVGDQTARRADTAGDDWAETVRRTERGLSFQVATARVGDHLTCFAAAADDKYLYALRLECPASADHRALFEAVLDGVVPLEVGVPPTLAALSHWSD